jgi:hypothetical protein
MFGKIDERINKKVIEIINIEIINISSYSYISLYNLKESNEYSRF